MAQFNSNRAIKMRDSLREYLEAVPWHQPVAISLTLKQRIKQQNLDAYIATTNFRHFMNRLNRRSFGNATARFGKGLRVMSVLEHDELVRFHNHGIIDRPNHLDFGSFKNAIEECWLKTAWGYRQTHIVPVNDSGWTHYITKLDQKPEYDLAIDWMNARTN